MQTFRQHHKNILAAVALSQLALMAWTTTAFSATTTTTMMTVPTRGSKLAMTTDYDTNEATVTMRSLQLTVEGRPMGVILEELGDDGEPAGVFCSEVEADGPAYAAGLRDGDVLAALDGDESISRATLDGAMAMLGSAAMPLPVKVYRELAEEEDPNRVRGKTVQMAPRRLPSTKKLVRAATNKNFWNDPLMIGSAVLTVAMPLGIFVASNAIGK